jgi:mitogen-activated protein kinase 1/3
MRAVEREIDLLYKFGKMNENKYTTQLLDAFYPEEADQDCQQLADIFLVMEFISHDLADLIGDSSFSMKENQAKVIVYNILLSLKFLHTASVVHRDLKPGNILISSDCTVKLCDFGMARSMPPEKPEEKKLRRALSQECFTRFYRPPEAIVCQKNYDVKTDIWSFGCIVSEIIQSVLRLDKSKANDKIILFEGSYCFPVSPKQNEKNEFVVSSREQLIKIMEVLDSTAKQLRQDFFDRDDMYDFYIFCGNQIKHKNSLTLEKLHEGIGKDWIQLLEGCLTLDPAKRFDYEQCIALPLFDSIRDKGLEASACASNKLDLTADKLMFNKEG